MPILSKVAAWSLFPFDAAGLLTLLGVDEVNHAVGRLVRSKYMEFMPLLAPFVITGNRFVEKIPGYQFYDLTGGNTMEISSGWLVRYLISHEDSIQATRSILIVTELDEPQSTDFENSCALSIGVLFFGGLAAFAVLVGDWWGLASTIGILVSVTVRYILVEANRRAVDYAVMNSVENQLLSPEARKQLTTAIVTTRQDKTVTVLCPRNLVLPLVHHHTPVTVPGGYKALRYSGWIAFISHIIAVNQACFAVQVITTITLVTGTILYSWKFGCTDSTWFWQKLRTRLQRVQSDAPRVLTTVLGNHLRLELTEWPLDYEFVPDQPSKETEKSFRLIDRSKDRMPQPNMRSSTKKDLYAWLNPSPDEENSMAKWDMLPHMRPEIEGWWNEYQARKSMIAKRGFGPLHVLQSHAEYRYKDDPTVSQFVAPVKAPARTTTVMLEEGESDGHNDTQQRPTTEARKIP